MRHDDAVHSPYIEAAGSQSFAKIILDDSEATGSHGAHQRTSHLLGDGVADEP